MSAAARPVRFVHLQVHSEESLVDGLARIKPLVTATRSAGMPALALTEQCNLFSLVKFYTAAQAAGIKPIIGTDVWVGDGQGGRFRLTLLCQSAGGYRRLARLVSRSYLEGQRGGVPALERDWLVEDTDGLIALAGGIQGDVVRALLSGTPAEASGRLDWWRRVFPDRFYLDVHRLGRENDEEAVFRTVELSLHHRVPVVATNDVRFVERADFGAHEARVCIHDGRVLTDPRRPRRYTEEQYLKSPEEMAGVFADLPEALDNSVEIAKRCSAELVLGEDVLPDFPVPEGRSAPEWFSIQARRGLEKRLEKLLGNRCAPQARAPYDERLEYELDVITSMGFSGYYLIVADFIQWARDHGVPVGPGRGSGAGSLAAYVLGITDLDPLRYELLFERFLNPERVSMPDFDIDFCMDGRDRVIDYVSQRYGAERVSQIITFGTMAARAVVRDVGRVLGHAYGFVDPIAKLIPFELGVTLDKALGQEEKLRERYESEEDVRTLIDLAKSLEGITRNAGKHAGGVVIAPGPLTDYTPLYSEAGSGGAITQLDKDDVAAVGLVKFDFLGLRTLTIIDRALRTINSELTARGEPPVDLESLPTDDPQTFELIRGGATTAVFQLESRGMRDLIRRLQPDCFEDIIALVALFRPGPLQSGMVEDFIERKHGRAKVMYPHPDLAGLLKPTYGVILYQEQVMQIARVLSGYSLGGADILRKAMGKKQPEEMAKQRAVFVRGARARAVDGATASAIFDLIEKFAGYGFNRSHSAAYALIAYQTAWLKAHYPAAFMAAVLSADMDHTDKVVVFFDESRALGLTVEKPDVQRSHFAFTAADDATIRYGLGAIKGVGEAAVEVVVAEREANGRFADLFDLCARVDSKKVNRRALEAMIRAGALDELGPSRATLMASLGHALQAAEQYGRARSAGQNDMFGEVSVARDHPQVEVLGEWAAEDLLRGEKETLGLYFSGHPLDRYDDEVNQFASCRIGVARDLAGRSAVLAGLVVSLRAVNSRKGRMAIATLDDRTGRMDVVLYADAYARYRDLLATDALVVVQGEVAIDEMTGMPAIAAEAVYDLESARAAFACAVAIDVHQQRAGNGFLDGLAEVLQSHRHGDTEIRIQYQRSDARAAIALGEAWSVRVSEALLQALKRLAGEEGVRVLYR